MAQMNSTQMNRPRVLQPIKIKIFFVKSAKNVKYNIKNTYISRKINNKKDYNTLNLLQKNTKLSNSLKKIPCIMILKIVHFLCEISFLHLTVINQTNVIMRYH